MAEVWHAVSRGSLMGARGNSGVITSQILRGLVEGFGALDAVRGIDLRSGLRRASDAAYEAVMRPVEGTILTVARAAAEAVEALDGDPTRPTPPGGAVDRSCGAGERTPDVLIAVRD